MNREWEVKLLKQWSTAGEDTKYLMHWQEDFGNSSLIEQTSWLTPYVIWRAIISEKNCCKILISWIALGKSYGGHLRLEVSSLILISGRNPYVREGDGQRGF